MGIKRGLRHEACARRRIIPHQARYACITLAVNDRLLALLVVCLKSVRRAFSRPARRFVGTRMTGHTCLGGPRLWRVRDDVYVSVGPVGHYHPYAIGLLSYVTVLDKGTVSDRRIAERHGREAGASSSDATLSTFTSIYRQR